MIALPNLPHPFTSCAPGCQINFLNASKYKVFTGEINSACSDLAGRCILHPRSCARSLTDHARSCRTASRFSRLPRIASSPPIPFAGRSRRCAATILRVPHPSRDRGLRRAVFARWGGWAMGGKVPIPINRTLHFHPVAHCISIPYLICISIPQRSGGIRFSPPPNAAPIHHNRGLPTPKSWYVHG